MIVGPRYKKARRFGPSIFDKTQSQKFALREQRNKKGDKRPKAKSEFASQLMEKQKAKLTYGVDERKFAKYVNDILNKKGANNQDSLMIKLETRLDNVVYRLGLAKTRQATRQLVSHGHINVNGKRVTIPSCNVSVGDIISVRERSKNSPIFKDLEEKNKSYTVPSWLSFDLKKLEGKVQGMPKLTKAELNFEVASIFQFYSR